MNKNDVVYRQKSFNFSHIVNVFNFEFIECNTKISDSTKIQHQIFGRLNRRTKIRNENFSSKENQLGFFFC